MEWECCDDRGRGDNVDGEVVVMVAGLVCTLVAVVLTVGFYVQIKII